MWNTSCPWCCRGSLLCQNERKWITRAKYPTERGGWVRNLGRFDLEGLRQPKRLILSLFILRVCVVLVCKCSLCNITLDQLTHSHTYISDLQNPHGKINYHSIVYFILNHSVCAPKQVGALYWYYFCQWSGCATLLRLSYIFIVKLYTNSISGFHVCRDRKWFNYTSESKQDEYTVLTIVWLLEVLCHSV